LYYFHKKLKIKKKTFLVGFFGWVFLGGFFYCQPCLGRGGGLDVPVAHARVVHVRVVFVGEPFDGGVLAQETGA
jgi:hypothetical protein